ncbi:apolipoprotein N-acyltransferase [Segetibacter koreensis]|uniref:apolipoprotein N-acyltransferase n=1 Tax=Segetibacter koreensis TaxID=398037 RepID=UPI00036F9E14|nr:apolipoprotein N-acyltransferase [Segetibacter koreensis]
MKKYSSLILSFLSGLLLVLAWPVLPFTFLIFIAWVPLLSIADHEKNRIRFFVFAILSMFIWNLGTTWWIGNATTAGAVGAIVANSFLMTIPLWGFHIFKTKYSNKAGYISLIVFWMSFEYIHLNWQLSWPWLTLGNVFATQTDWVQWYEYTGVSGGSFWVLSANIMVYSAFKNRHSINRSKIITATIAILFLPFVLSYLIHPAKADVKKAINNVVIVQPNIDPYSEKFDVASTEEQIQKLIHLSEEKIDFNTRLVLWPETALPVAVFQNQVQENMYYKPVFDFVNRHPNITLQTGVESLKNYGREKPTNTARLNESDGNYYDAFNSAVIIKANQPLQFYNKSKLVPGVETLPDFLIWLGAIFEKFGGTTGGYGHDKSALAFEDAGNPYITAPIICYESIYGEYITSYIKKGANLLTIMTNDGWWANTPGHKQHLNYARLRAIETRKWIARSANTGISAVINSNGDILESRKWDEASSIKYAIPTLAGETFYVRNGDILFKLAIFLMVVLLGYHLVMVLKKRFRRELST